MTDESSRVRLYEEFFASLEEGAFVLERDAEGSYHFVAANPSFFRMSGLDAGITSSRPVSESSSSGGSGGSFTERLNAAITECLVSGKAVEFDATTKNNGVTRAQRGRLTPHAGRDGSIRRISGIIRVTDSETLNTPLPVTSEEYYDRFHHAADGMVMCDETGRFLDLNKSAESMLGLPRADLLGRQISDFYAPEDESGLPPLRLEQLRDRRPRVRERLIKKIDGSMLPVEVNARMMPDGRIHAVVRDISARKRAEMQREGTNKVLELIATGAELGVILETMVRQIEELIPGGISSILLLDADRKRLRHGAAPGLPEDFIKAVDGLEIGPAVGTCGTAAYTNKLVVTEDIDTDPNWEGWRDFARKFGVRSAWSHPIRSQKGEVLGTFAMYHKMSRRPQAEEVDLVRQASNLAGIAIEHIHAEEAQRYSEELFRAFMDNNPALAFIKDADGRHIYGNNAWAEGFKKPLSELIGKRDVDLFKPSTVERFRITDRAALERGEIVHQTEEWARPDGSAGTWAQWKFPIRGMSGQRLLGGFVLDISDLKRAEKQLRESEEKLRHIYENAPVMMYSTDEEGRFVSVNRHWLEVTGYGLDEVIGKQSTFVMAPESVEKSAAELLPVFLSQGFIRDAQVRYVCKDGRQLDVLIDGVATVQGGDKRVRLAVVRDISEQVRAEAERERLEEQIRHAQKLRSLGVLAGGIAHDFNNLLLGVLGNADLAMMELPVTSMARPYLDDVVSITQRAAELCAQLLAYSGKGKFIVQNINLSFLAREMAHLLEVSISKKAVLKFNLAHSLPPVEADPTQMRQVIMNLITNASDALADRSGYITISTGLAHCDRQYLSSTYVNDALPEGTYVYVEVADTGGGMPVETMARIFDPFFTTKFAGRGLGLAAVLGIVRAHRGAIKVESVIDKGSSFRVLFPVSDNKVAAATIAGASDPSMQGEGTILFADDEETLRTLGRTILERAGYKVLTARDGREAVERYRQHQEDIRAVILDLTMPRMSGEEALEEIRTIRADAIVVLSSGYNENEAHDRFAGGRIAGFLQKPYRAGDLVAKVREVLAT